MFYIAFTIAVNSYSFSYIFKIEYNLFRIILLFHRTLSAQTIFREKNIFLHVTCRPENWRCQQLMQIQQKNNPFYLQPTSSLNYFSRSSHNNFIFIDIIHKTYNKKKYQHYVTTNHEYASYYIMNKMAADMNIHNNKSTLNPYRWIVLNLIITTCICFNVVCFFL